MCSPEVANSFREVSRIYSANAVAQALQLARIHGSNEEVYQQMRALSPESELAKFVADEATKSHKKRNIQIVVSPEAVASVMDTVGILAHAFAIDGHANEQQIVEMLSWRDQYSLRNRGLNRYLQACCRYLCIDPPIQFSDL